MQQWNRGLQRLGFPSAARAGIRKRELIGRESRRVSRVCWQDETLILRFFQHGAVSFLAGWIAVTLGYLGVFFRIFIRIFPGAQFFTEPETMHTIYIYIYMYTRDKRW